MKHSIALLAMPARLPLRRNALAALALLVIAACGDTGNDGSAANTGNANQLLSEPAAGIEAPVAAKPAGPALAPTPDVTPEPVSELIPPMPAVLSMAGEQPLLEAIASRYPVERQLEAKAETGRVNPLESARVQANLVRATEDLAGIKRNLALLSRAGLPTYALIHNVARDGTLRAWLVFPDGGVVAGATAGPYTGLGTLQGGLGVERIAGTRGPQLKGQERQRLDADADCRRTHGQQSRHRARRRQARQLA